MKLEFTGTALWALAFLATAIMFVLKTERIIDWSYWVVFMPIWFPLGLGIVLGLTITVIATAIEIAVGRR